MSRFSRLLAWAFPSVPPSDLDVVLAAMRDDTPKTPAPDRCGEARSGAGRAPEGEEQELTRRAPVRRGSEHADSASPSGPPSIETDLFWEPSPEARWDLARLGALLDRWTKEQKA